MSKPFPDIDDGYGYAIKHTMLIAPARVTPVNSNKPPVLLGPNVRDFDAPPPSKEKKERVYKPCEKLLIKLKKEHLKQLS